MCNMKLPRALLGQLSVPWSVATCEDQKLLSVYLKLIRDLPVRKRCDVHLFITVLDILPSKKWMVNSVQIPANITVDINCLEENLLANAIVIA